MNLGGLTVTGSTDPVGHIEKWVKMIKCNLAAKEEGRLMGLLRRDGFLLNAEPLGHVRSFPNSFFPCLFLSPLD